MSRKPHPVWDNVPLLRTTVENSSSMAEVLTKLGISQNSGNYQTLKGRCQIYEINVPKYSNSSQTKEAIRSNTVPLSELFSNRGIKVDGQRLRKLLISEFGHSDLCAICGQKPVWMDLPLVLETDHIDGNNFNNIVTNLRILCGHCHSQTSTFRGRNANKGMYFYCSCGKKISFQAEQCRTCSVKSRRNRFLESTPYPDINTLYLEYKSCDSFEAMALKYQRSSNALRKYIRSFDITLQDFRNGMLA